MRQTYTREEPIDRPDDEPRGDVSAKPGSATRSAAWAAGDRRRSTTTTGHARCHTPARTPVPGSACFGTSAPPRGARLARHDEGAYRQYSTEEQRSQAGCPARKALAIPLLQATSSRLLKNNALLASGFGRSSSHPRASSNCSSRFWTSTARIDGLTAYWLPLVSKVAGMSERTWIPQWSPARVTIQSAGTVQ